MFYDEVGDWIGDFFQIDGFEVGSDIRGIIKRRGSNRSDNDLN